MALIPWAISWAVLAALVLTLAIYRSILASKDDETVHISDLEAPLIAQQTAIAARLTMIDRVGKSLTVVVLLYGLALAGIWVYQVWEQSSRAGLSS